MQWDKVKNNNSEYWECVTPYWTFKIIKLDEGTYGLYNMKTYKRLLKISDNTNELRWYAYDLNLQTERRIK